MVMIPKDVAINYYEEAISREKDVRKRWMLFMMKARIEAEIAQQCSVKVLNI